MSALILLDLVALMGPSQAKVLGPNGQIVFGRFDPAIGDDDIYVINPDGTHKRLVVPGPHEAPVWSPDGSRIAMAAQAPDGRATTAIVNGDGSGYVLEPLPDPTLNLICGPWTPDGSRLACLGFDHSTPGRHEGVFTVRASDWSDLQRVTSNPCLGENCEDDPGDFSPDGSQIVFVRHDPLQADGTRALFVVNTDGTGLRRITPWGMAPDSGGSWSPDGRRILFAAKGTVFVVHPDGSGLRQIHIDVGGGGWYAVKEPVWSPNGRRIAVSLFLRQSSALDIYTMRADGTHLVQLTHSRTGDEFPDWGTAPRDVAAGT